jgi:glycosyltransferase involved in cell wall biosynthesis
MFVHGLLGSQIRRGYKCILAAPEQSDGGAPYPDPNVELAELTTSILAPDEPSNSSPLERMKTSLSLGAGTIWHQHGWTQALWLPHLRAAKHAGCTTVVTIHLAGDLCLRGSMLRFGQRVCDGKVAVTSCGACWAQWRGAPRPIAELLSVVPAPLAKACRGLWRGSRIGTALSAPILAADRLDQMRELIDLADGITVGSQWLYDMLMTNSCPERKLALCRPGIDPDLNNALKVTRAPIPAGPLRISYIGRLHPGKGVETLVEAFAGLPTRTPARLDLYGLAQTDEDRACAARINSLAATDGRISVLPPVSRSELPRVLLESDIVAVPSIGLETGPLVVLEAQASGASVLGSSVGGIAERVVPNETGILVPPGDVAAWREAMLRLTRDMVELRSRRAPGNVRTMDDTGEELDYFYRKLLRASRSIET